MHAEKLIGANAADTTLVIGVGNADRGDDAVGLVVASRLKRRAGRTLTVVEQPQGGLSLIEVWEGVGTVILLDAARSGGPAGQIHRIDATAGPMPTNLLHCSTHAFGVVETIELARALRKLPPRVIVYGIEGAGFKAGAGLSEAVEKAAGELERLIIREFAPQGEK